MKSLREISNEIFTEMVRLRGYSYFRDRRVFDLNLTGNTVQANVQGSDVYLVEIIFDPLLYPKQRSCTCTYTGPGDCKHKAAVLFHLNSIGFFTTQYYIKQVRTALGVSESEAEMLDLASDKEKNENSQIFAQRRRTPKEIAKKILDRVDEEIKQKINAPKTAEEIEKEKLHVEQRALMLEEIREKEQVKLFRERMEHLFIPQEKPKKQRFTKEYVIRLIISNRRRELRPLIVNRRENHKLSSERELTEKEFREIIGLPDELHLALNYALQLARRSFMIPAYPVTFVDKSDYATGALFNRVFSLLTGHSVEVWTYSEAFDIRAARLNMNNDEAIISRNEASAVTTITKNEDLLQLTLNLIHPDFDKIDLMKAIPVCFEPLWFLYKKVLFRVSNITLKQYTSFAATDGVIHVSGKNLEYFEKNYVPSLPRHLNIESDYYLYKNKEVTPSCRLYLEESGDTLTVSLRFVYEDIEVLPDSGSEIQKYDDGVITRVKRSLQIEETAANALKRYKLREKTSGQYVIKENPVDFLLDTLPKIAAEGFTVLGEDKLTRYQVYEGFPQLRVFVSSGVNWLEIDASLAFGEETVPLSELITTGRNARKYVKLNNGKIARLAESMLYKLQKHLALAEIQDGKLFYSKTQAGAVMAILEEAEESGSDDEFRKNIDRLQNFEKIVIHNLPAGINGELRPYQKHGFDWFYFLQEFNFGGILADDMGLGKTLQVLALILKEKERGVTTPSLVVVPTSVVFNWLKESERFTPSLRVLNHTGGERTNQTIDHFDEYDIIITSYGIILRDFEQLSAKSFHYIILDESQKIKNPVSKSSRLVRKLDAKYRLCLSGTPVENNLLELWSQMTFLNPGMLGSLQRFQDLFVHPPQGGDNGEAAEYLRRLIYPFILRRTKENVAKELPSRTEIIHYCEMTPEQETFYNSVRDAIRQEVLSTIDEKGIERSGIKIIEGLLRLRQICNHPVLVNENFRGTSGKYEEFKEMVVKVVGEDHKLLIFSQFVSMLDIMQRYLKRVSIKHELLTGQTKDRGEIITNFQENDAVKAFLISLKAGGFGLNLTAADIVFLYDPWWNPAVEKQAADRTHRIGQTKNIFIYKFITRGTVEEKILELQDKKRQLVEKILTTEKGLFKSLTRKDIDNLFS